MVRLLSTLDVKPLNTSFIALTLLKNGVKPTVIDTGHYLQRLAPNQHRGTIVSINARRTFNILGLDDILDQSSMPLSYYSRTDAIGKPYGSVNFKQMEFVHKSPTSGIGHLHLEKILFDEVAKLVKIRHGATVRSIQNVTDHGEPKAIVDYLYKNGETVVKDSDIYDIVVIADGTFSPTRKLMWNDDFAIRGLCTMWETVIKRPKEVPQGHYIDMWGEGARFGYFPLTPQHIYVYGQSRKDIDSKQPPNQKTVSPSEFLNSVKGFGGHYETIKSEIMNTTHCTETISLFSSSSNMYQGRVVCLGNAFCTTPVPSNGHDIAIAVNSAHFLATSLLFKIHSVETVLKRYELTKNTYDQLLNTYSGDIASSIVNQSAFGSWGRNLWLKFQNSDSKLTSRETQFLRSAKSDLELHLKNKNMVETMRQEYMSLNSEQRKSLLKHFEESRKINEAKHSK